MISSPCNNNCALLSSSLSPKSPIIALETLGASLNINAVCLIVFALRPVSAYEKMYPLSSSNPPSVKNAEPQCDINGVIVLLISTTPVLSTCAAAEPALYVLSAPDWKLVNVVPLVHPVSVFVVLSLAVKLMISLSIYTVPKSGKKLLSNNGSVVCVSSIAVASFAG